MNEITYLFVVPVSVALILTLLRRQRARNWWIAYFAVVVVTAVLLGVGGAGVPMAELVGTFVLYLLPLSLMFLVLRAELFERRVYLVVLLGPFVYLVGAALALSVVVTLGLLQP